MSEIDWGSVLSVGIPLGACVQFVFQTALAKMLELRTRENKALPEPQPSVIFFGKSEGDDGVWDIVVFDDGLIARRYGGTTCQWGLPGGRYLNVGGYHQKAIDCYEKCSRERKDQAEFLRLLEQSKSV